MPQIAIRFSDEDHATLTAAAEDRDSLSAYVRTAALTAARAESGRQTTLGAIVARYDAVLQRSRPRLSPAEWRLVCDACNGLWLSFEGRGAELSVSSIPLEVADAVRLSDLATKWLLAEDEEYAVTRARLSEMTRETPDGQDLTVLERVRRRGDDLARRLAACSYAELAAVADVVETFWAREGNAVPGEPEWAER